MQHLQVFFTVWLTFTINLYFMQPCIPCFCGSIVDDSAITTFGECCLDSRYRFPIGPCFPRQQQALLRCPLAYTNTSADTRLLYWTNTSWRIPEKLSRYSQIRTLILLATLTHIYNLLVTFRAFK